MSGGARSLLRPELITRIASSIGLAALALAATAWGGIAFALFWTVAAAFFLAECLAMVAYAPLGIGRAVGAIGLAGATIGLQAGAVPAAGLALLVAAATIAWRAHGHAARLAGPLSLAYASCVAAPVVLLRATPQHGLALVLWLYAVVWATDIGAYFVGRTVGGPKLWPRVSPNKTWAGFVGGLLAGLLAGLAVGLFFADMRPRGAALAGLSLTTSLATHLGDLFEFALKRSYSVKDSSQLIPGHGGFMDRLDGFALASCCVVLALNVLG